MAAATIANVDTRSPADKIVCRLDLFPELVRTLHDGDVLTGRLFCAKLFDCGARRNLWSEGTPTLHAANKIIRMLLGASALGSIWQWLLRRGISLCIWHPWRAFNLPREYAADE